MLKTLQSDSQTIINTLYVKHLVSQQFEAHWHVSDMMLEFYAFYIHTNQFSKRYFLILITDK